MSEGSTMEKGHGSPSILSNVIFRQTLLHKMRSDQMDISDALASLHRPDFSFSGRWEPMRAKRC